MVDISVGDQLRALLEQKKTTVTELAAYLHISRQHIHSVISNKSKLTKANALLISTILGANIEQFGFLPAGFQSKHTKAINLSGLTVNKLNLTNRFLKGVNFSNGSFKEANFSRSYLVCSNLSESRIEDGKFVSTQLTNANLTGCQLIRGNFDSANLTMCNVENADLRGAYLKETNLENLRNWESCDLRHAYIKDVQNAPYEFIESALDRGAHVNYSDWRRWQDKLETEVPH